MFTRKFEHLYRLRNWIGSLFWFVMSLHFPALSNAQVDTLSIDQLIDSAEFYLSKGQIDQTQKHLSQIYSFYDDHRHPDQRMSRALLLEAQVLRLKRNYKEGLELIQTKVKENGRFTLMDLEVRAEFYFMESLFLYDLGKYDDALTVCEQAYILATSRDSINDPMTIKITKLLGVIHIVLYNTEKSIELNQEVLQRVEALYGPDHLLVEQILNNLAIAFSDLREHEKALSYLQRIYHNRLERIGPDDIEMHLTNFNLGHVAQEMGNYELAVKYYRETDRLRQLHIPTDSRIGENYRRLGQCYQALENYPLALEYLNRAENFYMNLGQQDHNLAQVYNSFAELYREKGIFDKALQFSEKSSDLTRKTLGEQHPWLSTNLRNQAFYFAKLGDFQESKQRIQEALDLLQYDRDHFDASTMRAKDHLYGALDGAGLTYLESYKSSCKSEDLDRALAFYRHAIQTLDILRRNLSSEKSKLVFSDESIITYEGAIEVTYHLFKERGDPKYIIGALELSELSRRSTVLEAILARESSRFPGVPSYFLTRETGLLKDISKLEQNLVQIEFGPEKDSIRERTLQKEIGHKKQVFYNFLDSLAQTNPRYFTHRYVTDPPDIENLQDKLSDSQCIVEYFEGKEFIYAFSVTRDSLIMHRYEKHQDILDHITTFYANISNPDIILPDLDMSLNNFAASSHTLYQVLVKDLIPGDRASDLLIIPDGITTRIVFEILLTSPPQTKDTRHWSFLLQRCNVHYAESIMTLEGQNRKKVKHQKSFAGFAPNYQSYNKNLGEDQSQSLLAFNFREHEFELPGARKEIEEIEKIVPGHLYINELATEKNFTEQIAGHRILHLSTHALLNNEFPYKSKFLFTPSNDSIYDNELTAAEICYLNLTAELAVLSACHTGSGVINRGEGIMSLGRAFAFAGVPSTVQSLWRVPDAATSKLMPFFYRALKRGIPKHEALNMARLEYLGATQVAAHRHPYFWSGFILYGSTDAIKFTGPDTYLLMSGLLILVTLIWFAVNKLNFTFKSPLNLD